MNHMHTVAQKKIFSIVGPDVDLDMLRVLTSGDKVLAEINGTRLFSTSENRKIATDNPWTVEHHEPGEYLIISNPLLSEPLRLNYAELISSGEHQPAVFHKTSGPLINDNLPAIFVVLQLVSCKTTEDGVLKTQEPFIPEDFAEYLEDDRIKVGVIDSMISYIERLPRFGWRLQSSNRFRLRANISLELLTAFRDHNYEVLLSATDDQLTRIGEELHAMPIMARLSSLIQHDPTATAPVAKYKPGTIRVGHDNVTVEK